MRNIPMFSGLFAIALILPGFFGQQVIASNDTLVFCTTLGNAALPANNQIFFGESAPNSTKCSVHIWSSLDITDPCGGSVTYDVSVYPFDGAQALDLVKSAVLPLDANASGTLRFDTRASSLPPDHAVSLGGLPYTGRFCDGMPGVNDLHRVVWTVRNQCGGEQIFEQRLKVEDCTEPKAICVGLSSVVVPGSNAVTIWAKDFNSGTTLDDCTQQDDMLFSFSGDHYLPSMEFDCQMICDNGGPSFLLEIWAADEGADRNCNGFVQPIGIEWNERSKDYCSTFIVLDYDENLCHCLPDVDRGKIKSIKGSGIPDVIVEFRSEPNGSVLYVIQTDDQGYYPHFINPLLTVRVTPSKEGHIRDKVSTLDLIRLQKHLLGIEVLANPYQRIAADANNSQSIGVIDLVEIRKAIIGVTSEFPNGQKSWRFVPESHVFQDTLNPWPFPEYIITSFTPGFDGDFIGVKIGDLTGNVFLQDDNTDVRAAHSTLHLTIPDKAVTAGEVIDVPVYAKDFSDILGFQGTLLHPGLELLKVQSEAVHMEDCYAKHPGALAISWAEALPVEINKSEPLFVLTFRAQTSGRLGQLLSLSDKITIPEAYYGEGPTLAVVDVDLTFSPTSGRIYTVKGVGVHNATVDFKNAVDGDIHAQYFTDEDGYYEPDFMSIDPAVTKVIVPDKDEKLKNGITTLDMVKLQKHMLGIELFDNPYMYIAADVNNSESVSALDLVELRKIILGLITEDHREPWKFVRANYVFTFPFPPQWPFDVVIQAPDPPVHYLYYQSPPDFYGDFIGVKVGDITGNDLLQPEIVETRSSGLLQFNVAELVVSPEEIIEVPVYSSNFDDILGFQMTLDHAGLDLVGLESGALSVDECYAMHDGSLSLSWAEAVPVWVERDQPLFVLKFRSNTSARLSELLSISETHLTPEAYRQRSLDTEIEMMEVTLEIPAGENGFELLPNIPNPFREQTLIEFRMPGQMDYTIAVSDLHGKVIYTCDKQGVSGLNQVVIPARIFDGCPGTYICQVRAGDVFAASRKLVYTGR